MQYLKDSTTLCRTLDCILIKLDTALYMIRENLGSSPESANAVKYLLRSEEARRISEILSCNKDTVLVESSSPRFRNISLYRDVIEEVLSEIKCSIQDSQLNVDVERRPATWRLEEASITRHRRSSLESIARRGYSFRLSLELFGGIWRSIWIVLAASITLYLIGVLLPSLF